MFSIKQGSWSYLRLGLLLGWLFKEKESDIPSPNPELWTRTSIYFQLRVWKVKKYYIKQLGTTNNVILKNILLRIFPFTIYCSVFGSLIVEYIYIFQEKYV